MKHRPLAILLVVSTLLALHGAVFAAAMAPMAITAKAETAHYRLLLQIGPEEKMYSKAEAAKMHPTSGEIMVGGTMSRMSMGAMDIRHLEVQVITKATGKVVTNANCRITVTNNATKKSETVPVAAMYGVKEGPSDWHYGNNVALPAGSYAVTVVVNGEKAVFHVKVQKA